MNIDPQPRPGAPFGPDRTPYDALGGDARVHGLVEAFYDRIESDEAFAAVRALHEADLSNARRKLYEFLSGWLGGPQLYVERYGHPRLRARHMPFRIGAAERDQWLACMASALDDLGVAGDLRAFLDTRLAHVATFLMNQEGLRD